MDKLLQDIKKFTSEGHYQVNVPLGYLKDKIEDEVNNLGLQLNPDFQRGHVWSEEQQIKYMEYLLRGGVAHRTLYFNHPGWMNDFKGEFVLVDGLQRLTACLRFLRDEIEVLGFKYSDIKKEIKYSIDILFNINNLKTRKEVLTWYIEMNTGGVVHTEEEIAKVKKLLEKEK